jgi:hypothetical protein
MGCGIADYNAEGISINIGFTLMIHGPNREFAERNVPVGGCDRVLRRHFFAVPSLCAAFPGTGVPDCPGGALGYVTVT